MTKLFVGQPYQSKNFYAILSKTTLYRVCDHGDSYRCWENESRMLCCDTSADEPCEHIKAVVEFRSEREGAE